MKFREADITDIPQCQIVRRSVKENILSDPGLVTDDDYKKYLTVRGKGWVCENNNQIIGFAIADLKDHNIWALFLHPQYEGRGIGKRLHDIMLAWYFQQTKETVWLTTAFNTRAETFYRMQGWVEAGKHGSKEIKFVMSVVNWNKKLEKDIYHQLLSTKSANKKQSGL